MMKANNHGGSLIAVLIFLIVLGLIALPVLGYYREWKNREAYTTTLTRLDAIDKAVKEYAVQNGRYPCAASLSEPLDTSVFGTESLAECQNGIDTPGDDTKRFTNSQVSQGITYDNSIRSGAVPVRTLGLPDTFITDGHGHRFIYTITEAYAKMTPRPNFNQLNNDQIAGIEIEDGNNNNATRKRGNVIFAVVSMGNTLDGSYDVNGALLRACGADTNCNFNDNLLVNAQNRSDVPGTSRAQNVRYESVAPCRTQDTTPRKIAYLFDTSGSMDYGIDGSTSNPPKNALNCPPNIPLNQLFLGTDSNADGNYTWAERAVLQYCARVHSAQWAMRRALKARTEMMSPANDPSASLTTYFTGFIRGYGGFGVVAADFAGTGISYGTNFEARFPNMCPQGGSPLGDTMEALADLVGNGTAEAPNKVIIVSDGTHGGTSDPYYDNMNPPSSVIPYIATTYPHLDIVFIDIGNPPGTPFNVNMKNLIESNNAGSYFSTNNPDDVLTYLLTSANSCDITMSDEPTQELFYCAPSTPPPCAPGDPACNPPPSASSTNITMTATVTRQNSNGTVTGVGNVFSLNNPGRTGTVNYVMFNGVKYTLRAGSVTIHGRYVDFTVESDGSYTAVTHTVGAGQDQFIVNGTITSTGGGATSTTAYNGALPLSVDRDNGQITACYIPPAPAASSCATNNGPNGTQVVQSSNIIRDSFPGNTGVISRVRYQGQYYNLIAGSVSISGQYGNLTMSADGTYSYTTKGTAIGTFTEVFKPEGYLN